MAGYVFVTTLDPSDVGFGEVEGTVALAATSHPDFDDRPFWDEDDNEVYDDDGAIYLAHWVVLVPDEQAPAGLSVRTAGPEDRLPPTAPMPMYLDSPGFTVIERGGSLSLIVPLDRIRRRKTFEVGALTAEMRVDATGPSPVLRMEAVLSQLDGGVLAPVTALDEAPTRAWPAPASDPATFDVVGAQVDDYDALGTLVFEMETAGLTAVDMPTPAGSVDGAPVLGYVFPTNLSPAEVGFRGVEGTLALAVTTHPDFDDTPLFDEDQDGAYDNDGQIYHVHWAVLVEDESSPAGLSVPSQADRSQLPPTAPMPMYLDSPSYHSFATGSKLRVLVPKWHLGGRSDFAFDAVTARMRVDASGAGPVLRVEEVVDVLSGDLSLPFEPRPRELN